MRQDVDKPTVIACLALAGVFIALRAQEVHVDMVKVVLVLWSGVVLSAALVFVHELGHALAAVLLTPQRVTVRIGGERALVRFALGRVDFLLDPSAGPAYCRLPLRASTPLRLAAIALAGPIASLIAAGGLAAAAMSLGDSSDPMFWVLSLGIGLALLEGVSNGVPFSRLPHWWPGVIEDDRDDHPSDGLVALWALRAIRGEGRP